MAARVADPDPYSVLGVPRSATASEIRAAYRTLGARFHPDRHQGNPLEELAAARMKEINRAYEVLSNAKRRAAYDAGIGSEVGGAGAHVPFRAAGFGAGPTGSARVGKWMGLLFLLPLLFRFGLGAARVLARGVQVVVESLVQLRGTPVAAAAALVIAGTLVFALVRRRRSRRG